ncbi:hypothetical protein CRG98_050262 [Punica granatum]|uniref:Uncharacterized protein n=1 Tax=Punica granatum TaxID=22663 RepID=A0A2I0GK08_PUNGR|nr:hypothetical protein CRG98_050262 [Punica granatum]
MSEVVRMLEGEGLAERWGEWQHIEVTRRQEYEQLQRRFDWGEDSVYNQEGPHVCKVVASSVDAFARFEYLVLGHSVCAWGLERLGYMSY